MIGARSQFNAMLASGLWLLSLVALVMRSPPVVAAEKVAFWYGALEFSIPVDSLETYAKTGEIDDSLAVYDQYFSAQKLAKLRSYLVHPIDFDAVTVSRWLNTSLGENILKSLGQIIKPSVEQNGFYALRSALILAADSPNKLTSTGLTPLNSFNVLPPNYLLIKTINWQIKESKLFLPSIPSAAIFLAKQN